MSVKIEEGWKNALSSEFNLPYFTELKEQLVAEREQFKVYPIGSQIFRAFEKTPFDQVKVVIIGQDPYHGPGQAEGLSFSVPRGIKPPPSLQNIFKELKSDINFTIPNHGNLVSWAEQGVLLLNAALTVRANQPGSHRHLGWEKFTDKAILKLSREKENLVFLLWGRYAQDKSLLIDKQSHLILQAPHPSPFSAASGFFGCKHFSQTNDYLTKHQKIPINWQLPLK